MPDKPRGGKNGRPPSIVADEKTLKTIGTLAGIQCTQQEAAAVLGVTRQTFGLYLQNNAEIARAWEDGRHNGLASLRRNQFKLSEKNATMCIWLGKQYLGQKDEVHQFTELSGSLEVKDARDKLAHLIDRAAAADREGAGTRSIN